MNTMNKDEFTETEESPLVMYLVVRESLNMSIGKTAAQVAHAAQRLQQEYQDIHNEIMCGWNDHVSKYDIFSEWLSKAVRKVVLKADEKEWVKLKELPNHVLIIDAGFTEVAPHTETVIGFWPMRKSDAPKTIKKLQLLK